MFEQIRDFGSKKVWGEHSLTIGGIACLLVGAGLLILHPIGSWSLWIGLAVIALGMALF